MRKIKFHSVFSLNSLGGVCAKQRRRNCYAMRPFCLQINFKRFRRNILRWKFLRLDKKNRSRWIYAWRQCCTVGVHTSYTRSDYNDASVARISTLLCLGGWQKSHKGKMKNWKKRTRRGDAFNKFGPNERAEENEIINVGGEWRNRRCHRHAFPTLTWFAYNSEHRTRTRLTMLREMNIKLHLNYYFVFFFVRLLFFYLPSFGIYSKTFRRASFVSIFTAPSVYRNRAIPLHSELKRVSTL